MVQYTSLVYGIKSVSFYFFILIVIYLGQNPCCEPEMAFIAKMIYVHG